MSKIKTAFENGKAFIAFITCGDPNLETTAAAVRAAVENGAGYIVDFKVVVSMRGRAGISWICFRSVRKNINASCWN